jgi:hypothetical protein
VGTRFHFPASGARSYLADLSTPSGNPIRHASVAANVLWFELKIEPFGPSFGYLFLSLTVIRLSGCERVAFAAVQSAIGDDFRHDFHPSLNNIIDSNDVSQSDKPSTDT